MQLTVDAKETASVSPSGENKAQEIEGEASSDDRSVLVTVSIGDVASPTAKTVNWWFSVTTRCWLVGEKAIDGSTK
jgi:hypothetical protein